ncbi:MAG: methyl-accepting chemotaxis protein, partial [Desulfobacteraceae bacterium]|nr:methyl-accepting chemotaxis protein [Desulfobacteraceae bacterium]
VTFYSKEGKPLTTQAARPAGIEVIRKDIRFEGESVGHVELGLSFASVDKAREEVSSRIAALVAKTDDDLASSSRTLLGAISVAAVLGIILLGGGIHLCLSFFVIGPLKTIMDRLDKAAQQVNATSDQVSAGSHQLAEGSSQQAAALEQTSSSLEEMAAATKQNAEHAIRGDALMRDADAVLGKAKESMTRQTAAMAEISKASEETSKIIRTIDEIAFQTNLLALNAAVEAARAGEAGAGFAVVADEVRNLAMRAAEAAKNTAVLIETTTRKVGEGEEMVNRTNGDFAEVAKIVINVESLVAGIAGASKEQSQGIEQINKAIAEIDKVTEETAAGAEESAGASEEMTAQAESLKSLVQDLMALVKGGSLRAAARGGLTSIPGGADPRPSGWREKPARVHGPHLPDAKKLLPGNISGNGQPRKSAEEVIPLKEKEEYEDF